MGLGSSGSGGRSTQDRGVGVKWGYPGNQNPKQGGGEMRGKEIRVIKTIFLILISIAFSFPTSPCFEALFAGVRRGKLGSLPGKTWVATRATGGKGWLFFSRVQYILITKVESTDTKEIYTSYSDKNSYLLHFL